MKMKDLERRELIRTRFGSYNYNLMTHESDDDYKVFVLPTKEDLFKGDRFVKEFNIKGSVRKENGSFVKIRDQDYKVHDIRELSKLLYKSNLNFIEGLFSDYVLILKEYTLETPMDMVREEDRKLFLYIKSIFNMRDDIARMNLPYLFNSSHGMAYNRRRDIIVKLNTGDEKAARKNMSTAYRILDFLERYEKNNFTDLKQAMTYTDKEKEEHMKLRYKVSIEDGLKLLEDKFERIERLEEVYKDNEIDRETVRKLDEILFDITFEGIEKDY